VKAIIVGATSGIGRELAKVMSASGYIVGITGRLTSLLDSLEKELPGNCFKASLDLASVSEAVGVLENLLEEMDGVDIIVINAGTGSIDPEFPLSDELETVAAIKGGPIASYNASKAYVSSYLEGLCCRSSAQGNNISVTDIHPGFVDTAMAKGEGIFWKAPVKKAARQIFSAIGDKRRVAYITRRWRIIGLLLSWMPFGLYRGLIS
jgi:short-subunit dehydrogenase